MKLSVPYFSQHSDVTDPAWRTQACVIVCLKMVLEYVVGQGEQEVDVPSIDELITEGVAINGYDENVGWKHAYVVMLARNHGFRAYNQEFKSKKYAQRLRDEGILKLQHTVQNGVPVIVSMRGMSENPENTHNVVLTGFEEKEGALSGFYYHNSDDRKQAGEGLFLDIETLKKDWRLLAIFFEK